MVSAAVHGAYRMEVGGLHARLCRVFEGWLCNKRCKRCSLSSSRKDGHRNGVRRYTVRVSDQWPLLAGATSVAGNKDHLPKLNSLEFDGESHSQNCSTTTNRPREPAVTDGFRLCRTQANDCSDRHRGLIGFDLL